MYAPQGGDQNFQSGSPSPAVRPDSRRRGSSFGFGSGFFSNLTSTLRASSSSTHLPPAITRSRASSSSRMASPALNRTATLPLNVPVQASEGSSEYASDYAATPTEESGPAPQLTELSGAKADTDGTYSIRLTPFIDHSSFTPALYFGPVLRKTKPGSRLAIGRYTDKVRDTAQAPPGSDAGVVFKSKVVSRTHAEFFVDDGGNWFIRDLQSSSGTFLNHVRLSPAGVASANTPLRNGDVLQLGMDFRGGVEDIFRCVKMRVETNRAWLRKASQFNKEAHARLKSLTDPTELAECAICLLRVQPCQAVFISPCSHCWHYKCIRPVVVKSYPQFLCPNCRETCDLEADLESDTEAEEEGDGDVDVKDAESVSSDDPATS